MNKPLISVIVLSYKNTSYLYQALDSLFAQDYPNIEVVVTNDSSDDFDVKTITEYFNDHKPKNLKNFIVHKNQKNLGTVKSINNAIKMTKGKYINFFAADDAFYDNSVISNFEKSFKSLAKEELIVTTQLGMYDLKLKNLIKPFISKNEIDILKRSNPGSLFNTLSTKCIVAAASTCYKKTLFEKHGYFDEKYRLVEDWSSALRFSRLGLKYNYFDFIAFKHRDGGISHGNVNGEVVLSKQYELDILNIMKHEVLPYVDKLSKAQKTRFLENYGNAKWKYEFKYFFSIGGKLEAKEFIYKNFRKIVNGLRKDLFEYLVDQLEGKKFKLFMLGLIFVLAYYLNQYLSFNWLNFLNRSFLIAGVFIIVQTLILTSYQIYKLLWPTIFKILRVWF